MKKKIVIVIFIVFAIAQFFQIDKINPDFDQQKDIFVEYLNAPEEIKTMLKDACYDCHSYETKYPWYTYIVPVGHWIRGHINHGRDKLNFSLWADYSTEDKTGLLRESAEEMEESKMPLKSYTWTHSNAKLSDAEKAQLIAWLEQ